VEQRRINGLVLGQNQPRIANLAKFTPGLFHVEHPLSNRISAAHSLFHVKHLAYVGRLC